MEELDDELQKSVVLEHKHGRFPCRSSRVPEAALFLAEAIRKWCNEGDLQNPKIVIREHRSASCNNGTEKLHAQPRNDLGNNGGGICSDGLSEEFCAW